MEPIRVLHVLGSLDRAGAETMVMNIYRNIHRERIQFDFIIHTSRYCDYEDEVKRLGGKIYRIDTFNGRNLIEYIYTWFKFFKIHHEYKIIHGHMYNLAAIYLLIARCFGKITIAHSHSTSNGNSLIAYIKDLFCYPLRYVAEYKFACSFSAGLWLYGKKFYNSEKSFVLLNAIDLKKYCNEKINNYNDRKVFCHIGRFEEVKNHVFLIEIFAEYLKLNKDAVLYLVGNGSLREQIEIMVRDFHIEDFVYFLGVVDNVAALLKKVDALILPSLYEGIPMVLIEAQASGVRCFISDKINKEAIIGSGVVSISLSSSAKEWAKIIYDDNLELSLIHI